MDRRLRADLFTYTVRSSALVAGATANIILSLDASTDFMWYYSNWSAANSAANTGWTSSTRQLPNVTVLMTPGDSNANLSNIALPLHHMFGNGENPFVLPQPRKLAARSIMTFQLNNLDSTITYDIWISLIGMKVFG